MNLCVEMTRFELALRQTRDKSFFHINSKRCTRKNTQSPPYLVIPTAMRAAGGTVYWQHHTATRSVTGAQKNGNTTKCFNNLMFLLFTELGLAVAIYSTTDD